MKRIRHGRRGPDWRDMERPVSAPQARHGEARRGLAGPGFAGTARQGLALLGAAWSGWRSWAWLRTKGGGISCPQPFF